MVELGRRAGVEIGEVYRVDASRRSTALNAYVAGLGPTKRVVLYDNLIEDVERAQLESVVAHELGHVAHSDIPRGIAFAALVTPLRPAARPRALGRDGAPVGRRARVARRPSPRCSWRSL